MRTLAKVVALFVLGVLVATAVGLWSFDHDSRTVVVGAHTTTVSPTFDDYATFDFGPLLPRARIPVQSPGSIGVAINVGETDASNVDQLIARDAVIASQPEGEIEKIRSTVRAMVRSAAMRGAGFGVLAVVASVAIWAAVGAERRAELVQLASTRRRPQRRTVVLAVSSVAVAAVAVTLVVWPQGGRPESAAGAQGWQPLRATYPNIARDPILDQIQLAKGSTTNAGLAVVNSGISTYQASVRFYGALRDRVPTIESQLHQPEGEQKVAMLVSDRHDNIGMDPVTAAVATAARASILIDAGDDTSSGGSWEAFSTNSLGKQFKDLDKVGIAGNHDEGTFVRKALQKAGFTVLNGKAVTVAGITFLGDSDPRSSGLTAGYLNQGSETLAEQDARLTKVACDDKNVSTVVVHSPSTAKQIAASGCVDLVLSGHLHRQVGPETSTAANGRSTVTYTNGTTGGAVYAFALGSKLRRPAEVTLVTYDDGRPVGLQPVMFDTGGEITVAAYTALDVGADASARR